MYVQKILKLDVKLQKVSAIAVAVNYWELPNIKYKIRRFFEESYPEDEIHELWTNSIIKYVAGLVDSLCLSVTLTEEIKCYVYTVGGLIFDFIHNVTQNGIAVDFGLKIRWASYGKIDELRMAKDWVKKCGDIESLYSFLCLADIYTCEKFAKHAMVQIKSKLSNELSKLLGDQRDTSIPAKDQFLHCFEYSNFQFAAIQLWNDLGVMEKEENVVRAAVKCLIRPHEESLYLEQKQTDLLLFFINQMSADVRLKFLLKNYVALFKTFIKTWPHREFCINILNSNINFYSSDMYEFFDCVIVRCLLLKKSPEFRQEYLPIPKYKDKNDFHAILRILLEKATKKFKLEYFKKHLNYFFYFHHDFFDYVTISIIANDVALKNLKHKIVSKGSILFEKFILCGCYNDLDTYIEHVLSDKKEIELFKKKLNRTDKFVAEGKFEMATRNVNWICDTKSEKKAMKGQVGLEHLIKFFKEKRFDLAEKFVIFRYDLFEAEGSKNVKLYFLKVIDPVKFCENLINEMELDAADNCLIWLFETEEERMNFKKTIFKSDEDLRCKIYQLWRSNEGCSDKSGNAASSCSALLKFFLQSDEAVNDFRKNKLFEKKYFLQKFSGADFGSCKEFLNFCLLEPKQKREMINAIVKSYFWYQRCV